MAKIRRWMRDYHFIWAGVLGWAGWTLIRSWSVYWSVGFLQVVDRDISSITSPRDSSLDYLRPDWSGIPGFDGIQSYIDSAGIAIAQYAPAVMFIVVYSAVVIFIWLCTHYRRATRGRSFIRDRWKYHRSYAQLLLFYRHPRADPLLLDPETVPDIGVRECSGMPLAELDDGRCIFRPTLERGNSLVIGAPGTGKSTGALEPAILRFGRRPDGGKYGSLLVFDVKGQVNRETAHKCHGDRRKVFRPADPAHSCTFDPLRLARRAKKHDDLVRELRGIAEVLIDKDPKDSAFYSRGGRDFVVAALLHLLWTDAEASFYQVALAFREYTYQEMVDAIKQGGCEEAIAIINGKVDLKDESVAGLYEEAQTAMCIFADDVMEELLSTDYNSEGALEAAGSLAGQREKSALCIDDLLSGYDCFVEVEPGALTQLAALLALIVQQLGEEALRLPDSTEREAYPLLFCIDELAQYNRIPVLPQLMELGRSRGISTMCLMQSKSQLRKRYSEEEIGTMIDCTRYILLMSVRNPADQRFFAEMLGRVKTLTSSNSVMQDEAGGRDTKGSSESREYWIEPAELGVLDSRKECIVYAGGYHIRARVIKGYQLCKGRPLRKSARNEK